MCFWFWQFLDFWLSFVVVIMTCLSVAALKDDTKAVAHIAAAIITAAVTKENATRYCLLLFHFQCFDSKKNLFATNNETIYSNEKGLWQIAYRKTMRTFLNSIQLPCG